MDSSSEIPRDVSNPPKSEPQICGQEECMNMSSTATSRTIPIMPLTSETIGEQNNAVLDNQYMLSSAGRITLDSMQSIYSSVQLLCSKVTEYNRNVFDYKVKFETLSMNPSLETLTDEELVEILNPLNASNKILLDEKENVNSHIIEIEEALEETSRKHHLPFDVGPELIDILTSLGTSIDLILAKQKDQTSLLVEIKSLSVTMSNKLHFKSSAVKKLLCELQSKHESIKHKSVDGYRSIILNLMVKALQNIKQQQLEQFSATRL